MSLLLASEDRVAVAAQQLLVDQISDLVDVLVRHELAKLSDNRLVASLWQRVSQIKGGRDKQRRTSKCVDQAMVVWEQGQEDHQGEQSTMMMTTKRRRLYWFCVSREERAARDINVVNVVLLLYCCVVEGGMCGCVFCHHHHHHAFWFDPTSFLFSFFIQEFTIVYVCVCGFFL